jgi:hypothetical protein
VALNCYHISFRTSFTQSINRKDVDKTGAGDKIIVNTIDDAVITEGGRIERPW